MKRMITVVTIGLALIIGLTGTSLAAGSNPDKCDTRYPVILAHGMGVSASILGIIDAWGRCDDALRDEGAQVFKTSVNGMDTTANKAADFERQVMEILYATGAEKVNIIGHSHGTLYTRYAISNLGLAPYVASYTGLCGPHRGSAISSLILDIVPDWLVCAGGEVINFFYAFFFGDTNPDVVGNGHDLRPDFMINTFNPNTPDVPGVYYQSWAAKVKTACPTPTLNVSWAILLLAEGANDGLVSVESAKWGNFRGAEDAAWWSPGLDHAGMVDQVFGITPGFDAPQFFVDMVEDLKNRGY